MKNGRIKNKKENFKQDNFLLYIPSRKHTNFEIREDRVYLIFNHNKAVEKFVRWLVKKPTISDMAFDELGSAVWLLIDGKATVFDIGKRLEDKFGAKCMPVNERLIMFIRYLKIRDWITFDRGANKEQKI